MYGFTGFIEWRAHRRELRQTTGLNYELDAIAACVIGGVSFVGGIGKIRGVIIGVVLLQHYLRGPHVHECHRPICSTSSRA